MILNLDVITSGVIPPNPSELLESSKLEELLVKLKNKYGYLFDTPPLIAVTDAFVLMKHSSQFVLVVKEAGVTERLALDR